MRGEKNLKVIERLLRKEQRPMRVREMLEKAGNRMPTTAMYPDSVIARDLALAIRDNPESKFRRISPGLYELKDHGQD